MKKRWNKTVQKPNESPSPKQKGWVERFTGLDKGSAFWGAVVTTRYGADLLIKAVKKHITDKHGTLTNDSTLVGVLELPAQVTGNQWQGGSAPYTGVVDFNAKVKLGDTSITKSSQAAPAQTAVAPSQSTPQGGTVKVQVIEEPQATAVPVPEKAEKKVIQLADELAPRTITGVPTELEGMIPSMTEPDLANYVLRTPYYRDLELEWDDRKLSSCTSVLLNGEAGTGKTTMPKYLAAKHKLPWLLISMDNMASVRDMFGQMCIVNGTSNWNMGLFTKLSQCPSIIHIAEVNACDPGRNFILHELLNNRRFFVKEADNGKGKVFHLHEDCWIVLDGNPPGARYNGTSRYNVAFMTRVGVINVPTWTSEEILKFIGTHPMQAELAQFYMEWTAQIRSSEIRGAMTLRELGRLKRYIDRGHVMGEAIDMACLNQVQLTDGTQAYETGRGIAMSIFDLDKPGVAA